MSRYSVRMSAHVHRDVEIEAESPEEAVKLSMLPCRREGFPDPPNMRPERVDEIEAGTMVASNGTEARDDWAVDGWEVLGRCEACDVALLSDRDEGRAVDDGGIRLCTPCCTKAVAEPADDPEATQVIDPPGLLLDELDGSGPSLAGEA